MNSKLIAANLCLILVSLGSGASRADVLDDSLGWNKDGIINEKVSDLKAFKKCALFSNQFNENKIPDKMNAWMDGYIKMVTAANSYFESCNLLDKTENTHKLDLINAYSTQGAQYNKAADTFRKTGDELTTALHSMLSTLKSSPAGSVSSRTSCVNELASKNETFRQLYEGGLMTWANVHVHSCSNHHVLPNAQSGPDSDVTQ